MFQFDDIYLLHPFIGFEILEFFGRLFKLFELKFDFLYELLSLENNRHYY